MLAGRPVAYADFLGYDEVAHHSGHRAVRHPGRCCAASTSRSAGCTGPPRSRPGPTTWSCLSDHGQTQGWAFADRFGETDRGAGRPAVRRPGRGPRSGTSDRASEQPAGRPRAGRSVPRGRGRSGPIARRLRERAPSAAGLGAPAGRRAGDAAVPRVAPGVVCVVSGHTAMVSFTDLPGRVPARGDRAALAGPAARPGRPRRRSASCSCTPRSSGRWCSAATGCTGWTPAWSIGEDPLPLYGPHAAALVARTSTFPHCADVMINSRLRPGHRGGVGVRAARRLARRARRTAAARVPRAPRVLRRARARSSAPSTCTGCCAAG